MKVFILSNQSNVPHVLNGIEWYQMDRGSSSQSFVATKTSKIILNQIREKEHVFEHYQNTK